MLNELTKIGLSNKEAKVYLAALELGKASIQDIAKKAGINRTTTYVMITELEKRGLVKPLKVGKRNYFVAESPDTIIDILKKEKQEIENKEQEIREIIPELKTLYNIAPGRPKIRFYEGQEVYKKITDDILESGTKEILEIYNADLIKGLFSENETKEYTRKRIAKGIRCRVLYTRSEGPFKNRLELAEERFYNQSQFPVSGDIMVYGNRIGMASLKGNMIGVIIESDEISETMKSLFNLAWKNLDQLHTDDTPEDDDLEGGE